jgi:hypothetical protein
MILLTILLKENIQETSWIYSNIPEIVISVAIAMLAFAYFLGRLTVNVSKIEKSQEHIPSILADVKCNKDKVNLSEKTLDKIDDKITRIFDKLELRIETQISSINNKIDNLIIGGIATSQSPLRLNDNGLKIFKQSKIGDVILNKYQDIIAAIKIKEPKNAYQTQQYLFEEILMLKNNIDLINAIETGAFLSGSTIDIVLYTGALHIRDKVVAEFGFNIWDIDKEETKE